jgi:hypothetical protein
MVSTWCLEFRSTSLGSGPFSGELGTPSRHDGSSAESANDRTYKRAVSTHENQQSSPRLFGVLSTQTHTPSAADQAEDLSGGATTHGARAGRGRASCRHIRPRIALPLSFSR